MSQVTTFYSYKGGSGRSMTMANVAWALATNGERVLAIDWDLEAPGLHRYFHPFLRDPEQSSSEGLIDRLWEYIDQVATDGAGEDAGIDRFGLAACTDLIQPLDLPERGKGCLHLLGAGRQDENYSAKVGGLDWANFYARFDGERFIERLVAWARENYSHILIDSRTGVADTAGICTAQIPDAVVMCLVYNRQSIEGSAAIARSIVRAREERQQKPLALRFIPCRVEERGVAEAARGHAARRLSEALDEERTSLERLLRRDEIRHFAWCAFEEKLAVFEDAPDERGSLLDAMHELARRISDRKRLRIANIDPHLLASVWRRAAFDDPRLADLGALEEGSLDSAYHQLLEWVDDALDTPHERAEWLMALGEAAIAHAGKASDRVSGDTLDFLGRSGLKIANRAVHLDPEAYHIRFALLLQARAGQLQARAQLEEARDLAHQSVRIFDSEGSPLSRWRSARSLERMAEIAIASGDAVTAIDLYRGAAAYYGDINRRDLPLGAALDPARSLRILAEHLLAFGELEEAERVAEEAVQRLQKAGRGRSLRESAEPVNILAARAEIAAAVGSETADRAIMKVRLLAEQATDSPTARSQLDRRLEVAEARLLIHRGKADQALWRLERAAALDPEGFAFVPNVVELRTELLLDAGRTDEAVDILAAAMADERFVPSPGFFDLVNRVAQGSGRRHDLQTAMMALLRGSDRGNPGLLQAAMQWLLSQDIAKTNTADFWKPQGGAFLERYARKAVLPRLSDKS